MHEILLAFLQFLWNLKFIFSGSHNSSSSVLLQLTNYIYSLSKMRKRMRYGLNYPGTRFWKIKITQFPDGFRLNSSKANSQPWSRPRKYHIKEFRRCVSLAEEIFSLENLEGLRLKEFWRKVQLDKTGFFKCNFKRSHWFPTPWKQQLHL